MQHRTVTVTIMLLFLMTVLPGLAGNATKAAAESGNKPIKGLAANDLQQIQGIGQAVLMAKRKAPADAEMDNLRQKVETLRDTISLLDDSIIKSKIKPNISLKSNEDSPVSALDDKKGKIETVAAENKVWSALSELRTQRILVKGKVMHNAEKESVVRHQAIAKVEELEIEVENALRLSGDEQTMKFKAFKNRLAIDHSYPVKEKYQGQTPTVSTIVKHRE